MKFKTFSIYFLQFLRFKGVFFRSVKLAIYSIVKPKENTSDFMTLCLIPEFG